MEHKNLHIYAIYRKQRSSSVNFRMQMEEEINSNLRKKTDMIITITIPIRIQQLIYSQNLNKM